MTMADTVAVMNKGAIEQMGSPEELYELPKTVFVANFLGQSNLFTGPVTADSGETVVVAVGGRRIAVPKSRAQRHTGTITVGVRPEKLLLHTSEPEAKAGVNVLGPGRITDVSFTGVSTQYTAEIPGVGPIVVFAQNLVFGPVVDVGAEVWVAWTVDHGFGLADEVEDATARFPGDASTGAIAIQTKEELLEELGEL